MPKLKAFEEKQRNEYQEKENKIAEMIDAEKKRIGPNFYRKQCAEEKKVKNREEEIRDKIDQLKKKRRSLSGWNTRLRFATVGAVAFIVLFILFLYIQDGINGRESSFWSYFGGSIIFAIPVWVILLILSFIVFPLWDKKQRKAEDHLRHQLIEADMQIKAIDREYEGEIEDELKPYRQKLKQELEEFKQKQEEEMAQRIQTVNDIARRVMSSPEIMEDMVNHTVMMLERMIGHADHGTSRKFIEAKLTFEVDKKEIRYIYPDSGYDNGDDRYVFFDHSFKDLQSDAECEGVAMALSELTEKHMREKLKENTFNLTANQVDSTVDLDVRQLNPDFISFRSIV